VQVTLDQGLGRVLTVKLPITLCDKVDDAEGVQPTQHKYVGTSLLIFIFGSLKHPKLFKLLTALLHSFTSKVSNQNEIGFWGEARDIYIDNNISFWAPVTSVYHLESSRRYALVYALYSGAMTPL
jgi:hypothetical protein